MQIINDLYNLKNIYIHVYHIVCVWTHLAFIMHHFLSNYNFVK